MSTCVNPAGYGSPLSSKVALFDAVANKHIQNQKVNPFSNDQKVGALPRPKISKEDYGRPARGSLSEARGFKATQQVGQEMLQLCEIINKRGEPLFTPEEKADDPRVVISFGELFDLYTVISSKLVGILLRARKHKLVDFEGECLFQRRDDHVPVILLKPIKEIREMFHVPGKETSPTKESSDEESPAEKETSPPKESLDEETPAEKETYSPPKESLDEETPAEKETSPPEEPLDEESPAGKETSPKESLDEESPESQDCN